MGAGAETSQVGREDQLIKGRRFVINFVRIINIQEHTSYRYFFKLDFFFFFMRRDTNIRVYTYHETHRVFRAHIGGTLWKLRTKQTKKASIGEF